MSTNSIARGAKKSLTNKLSCDTIKKNKGDKTMTYYFEIKNTKTNECATAIASGMKKACEAIGWKVRDCKCIYRAEEEA